MYFDVTPHLVPYNTLEFWSCRIQFHKEVKCQAESNKIFPFWSIHFDTLPEIILTYSTIYLSLDCRIESDRGPENIKYIKI